MINSTRSSCHRDMVHSGHGWEPVDTERGVASRCSLLVFRLIAVSSEWCAAGTVLLLLVVVAGHSNSGAVTPNTVLLVVSRPRTRSSPWGFHRYLLSVRKLEEE